MLRHTDHSDQNYSPYYPQYPPTAAYDYSLQKAGDHSATSNSNNSCTNSSRKRRAGSDFEKDLEERHNKRVSL